MYNARISSLQSPIHVGYLGGDGASDSYTRPDKFDVSDRIDGNASNPLYRVIGQASLMPHCTFYVPPYILNNRSKIKMEKMFEDTTSWPQNVSVLH
ncbi:hypothetical protein E0Z10_g7752 [Xylaria hypoxylon]|uniref:Uncharacterized protein n=1 Tax=Xylaria hypoxylon TaxID=37992 RepID=A0A4Z0YPT6_9PEZI|nr:hypothetical protein E0Z10_g7752 [Xylaria hypoxylon]